MSERAGWLDLPLAPSWSSVGTRRTVLAVVHNVTSLTRLLDVVALLESDLRVQVVFTWTRSSPFSDGVNEFLSDIGAICLPWEQALETPFDLAISASYGGELERLKSPLIVVSHGVGYNKYLRTAEQRNSGTAEQRNSGTAEQRNSGTAEQRNSVFGLSREWLIRDESVVPSAIVLSHPEQLARLEADCPEAVPAALLAGDPCLDRMIASLPWRERYRQAMGLPPGVKLVVVTSTWGRNSLFGKGAGVFGRLVRELPLDEYRVAAVLHPNVWHGHSSWQVRTWLESAERSGLLVIPPRDGWRAALVAADVVVGDHGSVAFYGAVLGRPLLYATFPDEDVDPRSPVARLATAGPRLDATRPLLPQLRQTLSDHDPARYAAITAQANSSPGASARLLRTALYQLMDLEEPTSPALVRRVPEAGVSFSPVPSALVSVTWNGQKAEVRRFPATAVVPGAHLVVDDAEEEVRLFELADVLTCPADRLPCPPGEWIQHALRARPSAYVASAETAEGSLVLLRDGGRFLVQGGPAALRASAVYSWLASGGNETTLPATCTLQAGPTEHRLTLTPR